MDSIPVQLPLFSPESKECRTCHRVQPLDQFRPHRHSCKACACEATKAKYRADPETHRAKAMAYHWAHLDASHAKAAAWKAANRDRVKAYNEAYYAADVEEARARVARWRAANPESVRAYRERTKGRLAAYYRANAERASQQARERRLADPARNKARCAAWGKANPGKKRALDLRRRRRIEFNGGHYTGVEWAALKARYDYRCLMCGRSEPEIKLTFDHVVPVALGGTNDIGNGQPLCRPCNLSKGARTLDFR